jgi:hypothetical protein
MEIGTRIRHIQNSEKITGTIIGTSTAPRFRGQVKVRYDNGGTYFTPLRFLILEEPLESSEASKSVLIED